MQYTVGDVIKFFEVQTGLDWYPNPAATAKSELISEFLGLIEGAIAAQARATGKQHVAAEKDRDAELKGEAVEAFDYAQQWVTELDEDQCTELRKFSHAAV